MKVSAEVFMGCSLQPTGATVHNLVSLSRKKNSLPEMEEEGVWRENLIGSAPPVRFTALSPDQKGLA
jgi:hypothetical protein